METYYIPSEDAFTEFTAEQFERLLQHEERQMNGNEIVHMTPEVFAATWFVVDWMREKVELARRENTLLAVEVKYTPFGRYVQNLDVVNGNN